MKIIIISNLYEPYARGGAEAVVKTVAEGLAARGHHVAVLTAGPAHSNVLKNLRTMILEEERGGVRVRRFFPLNIFFVRNDARYPLPIRFLWRIFDIFNLSSAQVVRQTIARERPDVVITHNLVGIGMLVPEAIRRSGVRHIHTLHDVQLVHPSGLLRWGREKQAERSLARRIYEGLMRGLIGSPDVVIAPSRWLLDFHTSRGFFPKSKTVVLPNPVDQLTSRSVDQSISHLVNQSTSQLFIRLLYAGQLEPHKGVGWLLNVREPRTQNPELSWRLEFAGSGSLEGAVRRAAEANPGRMIYHGQLDREALLRRFAEVDALVVPSLCYENAPQVISEALAAGLPVIASRLGGIPELIRDGENGFLFTPGNAEEFFEAIISLKKIVAERSRSATLMSVDQYLDRLLVV